MYILIQTAKYGYEFCLTSGNPKTGLSQTLISMLVRHSVTFCGANMVDDLQGVNTNHSVFDQIFVTLLIDEPINMDLFLRCQCVC